MNLLSPVKFYPDMLPTWKVLDRVFGGKPERPLVETLKGILTSSSLSFSDKVLVHCAMGRSRSASLVLAYLMIYKNMTVVDAIDQVLKHRCILPNRGFLKQLRELDIKLALERRDTTNGIDSSREREAGTTETEI